jgi:hypothetical protein
VRAGKEAFAAGVEAADCPYSIADERCGEQRFLWLRGHTIARHAANGHVSSYADQTPDEMLEHYRQAAARAKFRDEFTAAFTKSIGNVDDRGYPNIVRDVVIEWLCGGAGSRKDFIDAVEDVADNYDWPEEEDDRKGE